MNQKKFTTPAILLGCAVLVLLFGHSPELFRSSIELPQGMTNVESGGWLAFVKGMNLKFVAMYGVFPIVILAGFGMGQSDSKFDARLFGAIGALAIALGAFAAFSRN